MGDSRNVGKVPRMNDVATIVGSLGQNAYRSQLVLRLPPESAQPGLSLKYLRAFPP